MDTMTENVLGKVSGQASTGITEGRLVFDKDRSRYLHKGFWPAMYDEVRFLQSFPLCYKPPLLRGTTPAPVATTTTLPERMQIRRPPVL
jgi:hypothetical protein